MPRWLPSQLFLSPFFSLLPRNTTRSQLITRLRRSFLSLSLSPSISQSIYLSYLPCLSVLFFSLVSFRVSLITFLHSSYPVSLSSFIWSMFFLFLFHLFLPSRVSPLITPSLIFFPLSFTWPVFFTFLFFSFSRFPFLLFLFFLSLIVFLHSSSPFFFYSRLPDLFFSFHFLFFFFHSLVTPFSFFLLFLSVSLLLYSFIHLLYFP